MLFDKALLVGFGVILVIYLLYKLLSNRDQSSSEYENLYDKVLNSEEYKVKGQHEK